MDQESFAIATIIHPDMHTHNSPRQSLYRHNKHVTDSSRTAHGIISYCKQFISEAVLKSDVLEKSLLGTYILTKQRCLLYE